MGLCFVPDCNHKSQIHGCSMYQFPNNDRSPKRRKIWIDAIGRVDRSPSKASRVCSCHFEFGKKTPTLFERNLKKKFDVVVSDHRKRKKGITPEEQQILVLENALQEKTEEINKLESRLKKQEEEMEALNFKVQKKEEENDSSKVELQKKEEENEGLRIEIRKKEKENEDLRRAIRKKENENSQLKTTLIQMTKEIVVMREKNEEYEKEINLCKETLLNLKKQENENAALKKEVSESKKKLTLVNVENIISNSEVDRLSKELEVVSQRKRSFHVEEIQDPLLISHFTGLPNIETFLVILKFFENKKMNYYLKWKVKNLSQSQQLLMTLMKLRRNLSHIDLALRFGVSQATVSNVIITWIHALHQVLVETLLSVIPSRHKNKASMPKSFTQYRSCRIILDCTEVFAANPRKFSDQNCMYSNYKHRITLKGLVGIAPNGTVTFLSKLYGGSTSDKNIVKDSGICEKLISGDYVMADKGFLIGDLLPPGVSLNIPPFRMTPQFTPEQVQETFNIAQARIHVERAIQRIKLFKILDFMPGHYVPFASKVFQVCGSLTNFMKPLIKEVASSMLDDDETIADVEKYVEDENSNISS